MGRALFQRAGLFAFGDSWLATPMHMWDTILEGRDALSWQRGRHSIKFGGSYRWYHLADVGAGQSRGYYSFTSGFTTQTATNDGPAPRSPVFCSACRPRGSFRPAFRPWICGNGTADAFVQDTWRMTPHTTLEAGLRYEFMSPLVDLSRHWSNLLPENGRLTAFIGGQNGMPRGLMYPNKLRFAPRFGIAHHSNETGIVFRAAYGIFYTPVDHEHVVQPASQRAARVSHHAAKRQFRARHQRLQLSAAGPGQTVSASRHSIPIRRRSISSNGAHRVQKSLGHDTTLEIGYQGERGFHLQRAHLINNALPGPGALQPRRPYRGPQFLPGTVLPANVAVASTTVPREHGKHAREHGAELV